ncbi:MAG: DUF4355 domain-containing protein [Oscillospiraceae bacterium]|jgi:hypothetical protein|nr:DUF4355 domain-containing protein [Oscillospiraceae bacterium]
MPDNQETIGATLNAMGADMHAAGGEPQRLDFEGLLNANKEYRAEYDRRISKSLSTTKANWETDAASRIEAARTEAEKLAHMSAEKRAEHEREQREADYTKRLKDLTLRELKAQAAGELTQRGLPQKLLGALDYTDADRCKASMDEVEAAFRESVEAGVKERLRGSAPKAGTVGKIDPMGEFRKAAGLKT